MRRLRLFSLGLLLGWLGLGARFLAAAEPALPPAPTAYFNDYAQLVRPATAQALNAQLDQFERATSNQIVVAIFPHLPADADLFDYTQRLAQAWKVGRKGRDNGAVLFVFSQDHKLQIQTGYGLEPVLTDALAKRIIEDEIAPRFRSGDYDGGMTAGVAALLAAAQGEYKGNGRTVGDSQSSQGGIPHGGVLLIFLLIVGWSFIRSRHHDVYSRNGRSGAWGGGPWIFPGGGGGGFGGGGGGGGGFSGGGGGFGGGGAGGSW
jgi:uncharacterized protein